jgi:uncharacterized protein (DUF2132 family)
MSIEELQNSPLHALPAETMLTELVEFYDWPVLDAAVDLKCFRIKPTIPSALVFLKKAEWARNKVEDFYLYCFKGMPKPSEAELELKPRERGFPKGVLPKKPMLLSVEKAEKIELAEAGEKAKEIRAEKAEEAKLERAERAEEAKVEEELAESTFKSRFSR